MSLYDKYGGFAAVSQIVHAFYDKVTASPALDRYFADVNVDRLIDHQTSFLCKVLGGPDNYNGRALAVAHQRLNITPEAFAEVARLLAESLIEAGITAEDVQSILGVVGSVRGDVVGGASAN